MVTLRKIHHICHRRAYPARFYPARRKPFYKGVEGVEVLVATYNYFGVVVTHQIRGEASDAVATTEHPVLHKVCVGVARSVFVNEGCGIVACLGGELKNDIYLRCASSVDECRLTHQSQKSLCQQRVYPLGSLIGYVLRKARWVTLRKEFQPSIYHRHPVFL